MPKYSTTNKYGEKVNDFKEKFVEGVTFDSMYAFSFYATRIKIIRKRDTGMFYFQLLRQDKNAESKKKVWGRPSPWYPVGTSAQGLIDALSSQMKSAEQGINLMESAVSCVVYDKDKKQYVPYDMVEYKRKEHERYEALKEAQARKKSQTPLEQVDPFSDEPQEPAPLPFSDEEDFPF